MSPEWIVWYSDGTNVSSAEAGPDEISRRGVICITCASAAHGRTIWWNGDYYLWRYGTWMRGDINGLFDYLLEPGRDKIVLFGRRVPDWKFAEIYGTAIADDRLNPKSSLSVLEEREGYLQDQTTYIPVMPREDELV